MSNIEEQSKKDLESLDTLITVINRVLIRDAEDTEYRLFKENTQYNYNQKLTMEDPECDGCGKIITMYELCCDDKKYHLREYDVAETRIRIPQESQDFDTVYREDWLQNKEHSDFDDIRTNNKPAQIRWKNNNIPM